MHRKIIPDLIKEERPGKEGRVCELPAASTALEAAQQMAECNVAAVAITDAAGRLRGIVTERDLTRRVMGRGLDPTEVTLVSIMTANPDTLKPTDTAQDALKMMTANHYRHLPVVDAAGRVMAMVSLRHLYAGVQLGLEEDVRECRAFVFENGYGARH